MDDPIEVNRRNWDERAKIHARDILGGSMLARFRAGEDALHTIEAAELGDISGKRVLHLQCHIGRDTLCLVRRGAVVTGLDFSRAALEFARRLADETGLEANFVQGTVDEATHLTPGPFDLVFATWGTLCWLPDMRDWARVIATVLAPGGELYCADAHPGFVILEEHAGRLMPTFDFQTPRDRPLEFVEAATYTGDRTVMTHQSTRVWIHPMSAILGALIEAGLRLTMFHTRSCPGGVTRRTSGRGQARRSHFQEMCTVSCPPPTVCGGCAMASHACRCLFHSAQESWSKPSGLSPSVDHAVPDCITGAYLPPEGHWGGASDSGPAKPVLVRPSRASNGATAANGPLVRSANQRSSRSLATGPATP